MAPINGHSAAAAHVMAAIESYAAPTHETVLRVHGLRVAVRATTRRLLESVLEFLYWAPREELCAAPDALCYLADVPPPAPFPLCVPAGAGLIGRVRLLPGCVITQREADGLKYDIY